MGDFGPGYLTAIVKFTEFWLKVDEAPQETRIFCSAVERIRRDLSTAHAERHSTAGMLDTVPDIKNWIDGILEDTREALHSVGKLLEKFRIAFENGQKISLSHRLEWVLAKREEFLTKSSLLTTCHQSLSSTILTMRMMEMQKGQSFTISPGHTETGVGPPVSVAHNYACSSVSNLPTSRAHDSTGKSSTESLVGNYMLLTAILYR